MFTKGPWTISDGTDGHESGEVVGEDMGVARIYYNDVDDDTLKESEANEKLITAAPELLEACQAIMQAESTSNGDVMEISTKGFERCAAAIAKATKAACGTCGDEFGGFMDYEQTAPCPECNEATA